MPEKRKLVKRINPRIRSVEIGIRSLRKVKIYPLSMKDQKQLIGLINKIIKSIFEGERKRGEDEDSSLVLVSHVVKAIEDNIEKLLSYVAPDENIEKFMKDCDNAQLSGIIEHVYRDNYGEPVKNVVSLFDPEQLQSVLKRQPSQSAGSMDTGLNTSSEEVSKKED